MNKPQKTIKAIIFPLIIIIITIGVAGDLYELFFGHPFGGVSAFDFDKTWLVWIIALSIIYKIEKIYFLMKRKIKNKRTSMLVNLKQN